MDCPAPDHYIFSRFRKHLSKEAMTCINKVLRRHFHRHDLTINAEMTADPADVLESSTKFSGIESYPGIYRTSQSLPGLCT